jgi:hypothetical protein
VNQGKNFLGFDTWFCSKCGLRWYDKVEHRHSHRCSVLRLYVSATMDGILCCPTQVYQYSRKRVVRSPDSRRRVFVGCDTFRTAKLAERFRTLNEVQVRALANVAVRLPDATSHVRGIVFYDMAAWGRSRAWPDGRHKIIHRVTLREHA